LKVRLEMDLGLIWPKKLLSITPTWVSLFFVQSFSLDEGFGKLEKLGRMLD